MLHCCHPIVPRSYCLVQSHVGWPNDDQALEFAREIQWGESSPAKHGGAYISAVVWTRILAITEKAIGRPQVPPNLVGFHLARIFGATGKEQPSPPLHLAAAARLLALFLSRDVRLVRLDLSILNHQDFSHSYLIFPSMLQVHYSP